MREIQTRGTFNAAALLALAGGTDRTAERTAKAAELTAKNTGRLVDEARDGGLAFG